MRTSYAPFVSTNRRNLSRTNAKVILPRAFADRAASNACLQSTQSRIRARQEMQRVRASPGSSGSPCSYMCVIPLYLTAGRYSKLYVLDLNLEGHDGFVKFVRSHTLNYSASSSSKRQCVLRSGSVRICNVLGQVPLQPPHRSVLVSARGEEGKRSAL